MGGRCDLTQCSSDDVTVAWRNQDVWMEVIACSDFEKTTRDGSGKFSHLVEMALLHFGQLPTLSDKKLRDRSADVHCFNAVFRFDDFVLCFDFWFPTCNEEVLTGRRRKQGFKLTANALIVY